MNVILFDGVCNLCSSTVQFIIKRDINNHFKFSSLQSKYGNSFLETNGFNQNNFSTIILIEGKKYYTESTAILRILTKLKGYKWMRIFFIFPKFLRDLIYKFISKNRYRLFGKKDTVSCMIPSKELMEKFI